MLDWNCKHEFLNHITEQITTYTYYPSCHQVYDVAKAIIQKFPYLCEKIGSGYEEAKKKKNVCLRSPDPPYFSAADPNLFYRQLFHPNFY
jgi:hypothetical protein